MDYLRLFPGVAPPSTWGFNDAFLKIIERQLARWRAAGYAPQVGLEINFTVETGDRLRQNLENNDDERQKKIFRDAHPYLAGKYLPPDYASLKPKLAAAADGMIADIVSGRIEIATLAKKTGWDEGLMIETLEGYRAELDSDDMETQNAAAQNIFMARAHLYNATQGGIRDLIEPRFGDATWGLGWWDAGSEDGEVRIPYSDNPFRIIDSYHRIIEKLIGIGDELGVYPSFGHSLHPQLHLSFRRLIDGKNMMRADDDDSADFCRRAANGLIRAVQEAPAIFQEYDANNNENIFKADFGTSRMDQIRQRPGDWEFRFPLAGLSGHIARHIALILGSTANGVLDEHIYSEWNQEYLTTVQTVEALAVKHRFGNPLSALESLFTHCRVQPDGTLKPPSHEILYYNLDRLKEEIGAANIKRFTSVAEEKFFMAKNLSHTDGWRGLLKTVRVTEDNRFDFGMLDPELAASLDVVEITGRRRVIEGEAFIGARQKTRLEQSFQFLPDSPSLRHFMDADLLRDITALYTQIYNEAREQEAGQFADRLHKAFSALAHAEQEPQEDANAAPLEERTSQMIKRMLGTGIIHDSVFEEMSREFEIQDRKPDGETPPYYNRHEQIAATHLQTMRPFFQRAARAKAETIAAAPAPDNYLVHALHGAADFLENDIYDIRHYDIPFFEDMLTAMIDLGAEGKIDRLHLELIGLAGYSFVAGFASMLVRNPDVPMNFILESLRESRERIIELFEKTVESRADDIEKMRENYPPLSDEEDEKDMLQKFRTAVLKNYDHALKIFSNIREEKGLSPPLAKAPWKYDYS